MNFSPDDIHRSLRRFIWQALPDGWKVRTERQPVADNERPVCVVEPSSPLTTGLARTSIPQGNVEKLQSFSAMAYPVLGQTAAASRVEAQAIATALDQAFTVGLVEGEGADAVNLGGPFMLPVYDFDGVPVSGRDRAGPADPYGYARVEDLAVRPLQDPVDYLRYTATCDLRLRWEQGGRLVAPAPLAGSIVPTPVITP
jgi:hypothetical protein